MPGGPTGNVAETREQQNSDVGADDRLCQIHHACGSTASRNCANGTCVKGGFTWLVGEDEIESSPMERVPQPKTEDKLVLVMKDWETKKLLDHVRQKKDFAALRDEASIRLFHNTGSRLSEIGLLTRSGT